MYNFCISAEKDFTGDVQYNYKDCLGTGGMTEDDLMRLDQKKYCEMVCTKIGQYLKLVHNKELIRMNCEFLVDDFDQVFLMSARDIWIREVNEMPTDHERMFSQFLL